jgi:hypothetical protein
MMDSSMCVAASAILLEESFDKMVMEASSWEIMELRERLMMLHALHGH